MNATSAMVRPARAALLVIVLSGSYGPGVAAQTAPDGCATCHSKLAQSELASPVTAFRADIHNEHKFRCVDCHGGDATTDEKDRAKDPKRGYRGRPTGTQVVTTCARCHSDAGFMRTFAPRQRVDQAAEYATSVHGIRLAGGDRNVATCTSCHQAHGIRRVNDARSPVFPTNVSRLCASCHSSAERMKGYTRPGGEAVSSNQHEEYEKSVHHTALVKQHDLSAPTCNDCHGNHGAAPPGVGAVSNVCGTCHAVFAEKFARSVHNPIFERACIECHGNHAVLPTSDGMIGTSKDTLCSSCHSDKTDPGFAGAERMRSSIERLKAALDSNTTLIARAGNAGMEVSDQELALAEARTKLTLARTEIHSFDPAALDQVVNEGLKGLAEVERAGHQALADLRFRRRGLFASLAAMLLVVVGLALKIRDLNLRRTSSGSDPYSIE
jgi:predicted CXXCH cytochrome family protein